MAKRTKKQPTREDVAEMIQAAIRADRDAHAPIFWIPTVYALPPASQPPVSGYTITCDSVGYNIGINPYANGMVS